MTIKEVLLSDNPS